ncbi:polysaccharide deacetylase family protein [Saccharicrinis sp. 156]|uniref:polysaccharide deacetylase family protein n=1 Tax=Saccharicrinis sp. 156 TaxID=3417574 RepID=UPI003D32693B
MRFGKTCWSNLVFLLLLSLIGAPSCQGKPFNNGQSRAGIKLPDDFSAVGLVYHRFGDDRYPSTNTPLDKFEEQLLYLTQNGFKTYTVSGLIKGANDSAKKIFITVDDGLKSFYTNGWPLLKKYNCKATLFVNTESVGWGDYLNWEQLKKLAEAGIEIGSHSHKHTYFLNIPDSMREQVFLKDLDISEQLFKDSLGFVPKTYAYPYGEYDEQMANLLKKRGYEMSFAQNSGVWNYRTHPFAIPRFPIAGNYVEMEQFRLKVNMKPILIGNVSDFPFELSAGEKMYLRLSVDSVHNLHRVNCFYNNKSNSDIYQFKDDTIRVSVKMPNNFRRVLLTFTSTDATNQWYWWSKLFVNSGVEE